MKFNYNQDINGIIMSEYKEKYESIDNNNNLYNILNYSNESIQNIQSTFSLLDIPTYFLKSFVEEDNNINYFDDSFSFIGNINNLRDMFFGCESLIYLDDINKGI